jgi:uncharacterized membrane protein YdbT with pleckstrin-like domain
LLGIIHFIIHVTGGEPLAIVIIWIVGAACLALMWLITTTVSWLWIRNLHYTIMEDGIRIHKGILKKTQQTIPYRMITDFALVRTLYDRVLGIGSIKIQTAGQSHNPSGYEGKIGGLTDYEASQHDLRERLKVLHLGSGGVMPAEAISRLETELLSEILAELKEIRKTM